MDEKLQSLRDRLVELNQSMAALAATADNEGRDLTSDELDKLSAMEIEFNRTKKDIDQRERMLAQQAAMAQSVRRTEPTPAPDVRPLSGNQTPPTDPHRVPAEWKDGKLGFRSLGEFARSVHRASADGGQVDKRLHQLAPSTYGNESSGSDGGFAVPPDFRAEITSKVMAEQSILALTDKLTTSSNSLTIPLDEAEPWSTSGVRAYWEGEAAQIPGSKPVLKDKTIRLNKLAALVAVTDELLADAPAMDGYIRRKAPEAISFKVTEGILFGNGVGMPLGIVPSAVRIRQTKVSGQSADTIVGQNISDMWGRLYGPCRQRAVWLYQQDIETQLDQMNQSVTNSTTGVAAWPLYLPPGGLANSRYSTLRGREMIPLENCAALGDEGDLILADMSKYLTVTKTDGLRQDMSIHLYFDYAMTAFRFIFRLGGAPWWNSPVARAKGANTLSAFVTLEDR